LLFFAGRIKSILLLVITYLSSFLSKIAFQML
jgi:hypothetical protein